MVQPVMVYLKDLNIFYPFSSLEHGPHSWHGLLQVFYRFARLDISTNMRNS